MDEHLNPCRAILSHPFIRKSTNPSPTHVKPKTPSNFQYPSFYSISSIQKPHSVHTSPPPIVSVNRPPSIGNSLYQNSIGQSKHQANSQAETSTLSHYYLMEGRKSLPSTSRRGLSRDLQFLQRCYEQTAQQNEALIQHVSSRTVYLDHVQSKLKALKERGIKRQEHFSIELEGLPPIRAVESAEESETGCQAKSWNTKLESSEEESKHKRRQSLAQKRANLLELQRDLRLLEISMEQKLVFQKF